jgi:hypothetical protein
MSRAPRSCAWRDCREMTDRGAFCRQHWMLIPLDLRDAYMEAIHSKRKSWRAIMDCVGAQPLTAPPDADGEDSDPSVSERLPASIAAQKGGAA